MLGKGRYNPTGDGKNGSKWLRASGGKTAERAGSVDSGNPPGRDVFWRSQIPLRGDSG